MCNLRICDYNLSDDLLPGYPLSANQREYAMNPRSVFHSVGQLDQLREFASGASLEIVQLGRGAMQGVLAHAELGQSSDSNRDLFLCGHAGQWLECSGLCMLRRCMLRQCKL